MYVLSNKNLWCLVFYRIEPSWQNTTTRIALYSSLLIVQWSSLFILDLTSHLSLKYLSSSIWIYRSVKSRIASSYAGTSALSRVACDVSRYGIPIASLGDCFTPAAFSGKWFLPEIWAGWSQADTLNCVFTIKKLSGNLLSAAWMRKFIYWVEKAS